MPEIHSRCGVEACNKRRLRDGVRCAEHKDYRPLTQDENGGCWKWVGNGVHSVEHKSYKPLSQNWKRLRDGVHCVVRVGFDA